MKFIRITRTIDLKTGERTVKVWPPREFADEEEAREADLDDRHCDHYVDAKQTDSLMLLEEETWDVLRQLLCLDNPYMRESHRQQVLESFTGG